MGCHFGETSIPHPIQIFSLVVVVVMAVVRCSSNLLAFLSKAKDSSGGIHLYEAMKTCNAV
jgi:hypothetical protein